jgi:hypothetical protein
LNSGILHGPIWHDDTRRQHLRLFRWIVIVGHRHRLRLHYRAVVEGRRRRVRRDANWPAADRQNHYLVEERRSRDGDVSLRDDVSTGGAEEEIEYFAFRPIHELKRQRRAGQFVAIDDRRFSNPRPLIENLAKRDVLRDQGGTAVGESELQIARCRDRRQSGDQHGRKRQAS